ncbi:MAG TPA: acyltransferase family protein [Mycobacteriales bacterium]|nr:acyltransferase family protein [Mycobacteriales bacterium]
MTRHWKGLDGLRGIAVAAVVIYHFSPATLPGGFLGVDIFFVISGYLITRLITDEFLRRRRLDAPAFYRRRARRLLPALATILAAVGAGALIWRDQLATVRPGIVFSSLFGANWWLALEHQPYFVATGRPSMLQHLWSLGVEEQYYLLWPLIVAATLGFRWRRIARRGEDPRADVRKLVGPVIAVAVTLALASTAVAWLLADRWDVPYGTDGSRLYYGTDTHSMGLLLGSALGAWAITQSARSPARARNARIRDAIGAGALVAVLVLSYRYASYSHTLYRGGFLLIAALVAVVIAACTAPASRLGTLLDTRVLRWVGLRSYSIYLWHWPIAVVTRPGLDTSMPTWLDQLLRVTLTLALSDATYRFVETPVRRLGFSGAGRAFLDRLRRTARPSVVRPAVAGLAVIPTLAVGVVLVGPHAPRPAAALATTGGTHLSLRRAPAPPAARVHRHAKRRGPAPMPKISGFGDSVLLDARRTLGKVFSGGSIDAVVGRQPGPILDDVRRAERKHDLNPVVVIHAGDNGLIKPSELERTLRALSAPSAHLRLILVVNDHLDPYDHSWQTPNNATIARVVPKFANARVVNWDKVADHHHSWLYSDDLHLRPQGAIGYADLLAATYRRAVRSG